MSEENENEETQDQINENQKSGVPENDDIQNPEEVSAENDPVGEKPPPQQDLKEEKEEADEDDGEISWEDAFKEAGVASGENEEGANITEPDSEEPVVEEPDEPVAEEAPIKKKPVKKVEFSSFDESDKTMEPPKNLDFILDIPLTISVELGRTRMVINDMLQLGQGSVIELSKLAGEPLDIFVNNKLMARGEVVLVNDKFGVRLTDIITPVERVKKL